jgi:predicted CXXCH cytochrome family protein
MRKATLTVVGAALACVIGIGAGDPPAILRHAALGQSAPAAPAPAKFVGSDACASCHRVETGLWRGSHHQAAMAPATEATVLGNFSDTTFEHDGVRTRFFRKDSKFLVETDGPDGKLDVFEVKYTFGVDPLQQYLVEFPGGRLQALPIAWDARPKAKGGQRWFHLYGAEHIDHTDELHWTRLSQNWNFMCADCHSTDVHKNYNAKTNHFSTTWAEIHVGCESCHGPGSNHIAWAEEIAWLQDQMSGKPRRSEPRKTEKEFQLCSQCHSRRSQISEGFRPGDNFHDFYRIALPREPLYFADGHQKEEVYVAGSFALSKMFAKGVTCSDCHDPHSGGLRAEGDAVCTQCHVAERYATTKHHFHQQESEGARCVSCHMPARTYMVADDRRDHSFQIPRPDLTVQFGIPNACGQCHTDKPATWADETVRRWYGHAPKGFQNFAEAFATADADRPEARAMLLSVLADKETPALARATAAADLEPFLDQAAVEALARALTDDHPVVRRSAVASLGRLPMPDRVHLLAPRLGDPIRTVRNEAVVALADAPANLLDRGPSSPFAVASREYEEIQRLHADRPEFRTNLANFFARTRRFDAAETELRAAIDLDRGYVPAYLSLAEIFRTERGELDAERVLHEGLNNAPNDAGLYHALGLSLVRQRRTQAAMDALAKATELAPRNARFAYVYAIALNSQGRTNDALAQLERARQMAPGDEAILEALISINAGLGRRSEALSYAQQLRVLRPDDPAVERLVRQLRQGQ